MATITNLNPDKYNQGLYYYPFMIKLDRCNGSCNTLDDPSKKICNPNKVEHFNLHVFNKITRINESKALTKHISCEYKCKYDGKKCNLNQKWNNKKRTSK